MLQLTLAYHKWTTLNVPGIKKCQWMHLQWPLVIGSTLHPLCKVYAFNDTVALAGKERGIERERARIISMCTDLQWNKSSAIWNGKIYLDCCWNWWDCLDIGRTHQLSRRSFSVAQDPFVFILLQECGHKNTDFFLKKIWLFYIEVNQLQCSALFGMVIWLWPTKTGLVSKWYQRGYKDFNPVFRCLHQAVGQKADLPSGLPRSLWGEFEV